MYILKQTLYFGVIFWCNSNSWCNSVAKRGRLEVLLPSRVIQIGASDLLDIWRLIS